MSDLLVWLAQRNSLTAHLRPSCGALAKRAPHFGPPMEMSAQPDPDREGWVLFRYVTQGKVRWRSARLCSFCGNHRYEAP